MIKSLFIILVLVFNNVVLAEVPFFRNKLSLYETLFTVSTRVEDQALQSTLTLQPTVLWSVKRLRSAVGVHFLMDVGSAYGLTPISGVGFSGYFSLRGLPMSNEYLEEGVQISRSRFTPYVFGGLTPINFNANKTADEMPDRLALSFRSVLIEIALGFGVDYPLRANTLLSLELGARFASADLESEEKRIKYSGYGMSLSFSTYYD